ncbi:MAG: methylmalonyl-CoA mutase family protein, partial [Candidatus Nanopelagicales bacterium]
MTLPEIASFATVPLVDPTAVGSATAGPSEDGSTTGDWTTPEGIAVRRVYTASDLDDLATGAHPYPLDSLPGSPPFLRGPYPT